MSNVAPWGSWKSPITAELITAKSLHLSQLRVDGADTYWVEARSMQGGRNVLLRRSPDGSVTEVLPTTEDFQLIDVRTRVHEYGGKAYGVIDGMVVVSHGDNGCLYRFDAGQSRLRQLTPKVAHRYGDIEIDPVRGLVYAIREDHTDPETTRNELVCIPLDGSAARDLSLIKVLWNSNDFVSSTALSHDGRYLAFTTWDHPNMIWTESALRIAELDFEGCFSHVHTLVDEKGVSCTQPRWTLRGDLIHVDDSSGWANLYRTQGFIQEHEDINTDWTTRLRTRSLHPSAKSFSAASWTLGLHSYDNFDDEHLICGWTENGESHLGTIRIDNGELEEWNTGWGPVGNVACVDRRVVALADSSIRPPAIVEIEAGKVQIIRSSSALEFSDEWVSAPETIFWKSSDGTTVQGFFYAPKNPTIMELPEGKPPLVLLVHGGPTNAARPVLSLRRQYWTSRGFAVMDVNFRGSTGFGRDFRDALNGNWGVMDVTDCRDGVHAVADRIDTTKVAIAGASSGGFTALRAASDPTFSAVTSYFGVSDLKMLAAKTHKFESKYLFMLLGSDDINDSVWVERSPIHNVDTIKAPVLLLQGDADPIVPADQARDLHEALTQRGIDCELYVYEGEGHGFRTHTAIVDSLLRELFFYRKTWGLPNPQ